MGSLLHFSKRTGSMQVEATDLFNGDSPQPSKLARTLSGPPPMGDFVMASSLMSPARTVEPAAASLMSTPTAVVTSGVPCMVPVCTPVAADMDPLKLEAPNAPLKAKKNKGSDPSTSPPMRRRRISSPELDAAVDAVVNGLDAAKEIDLAADEGDIQSIQEINDMPVCMSQEF